MLDLQKLEEKLDAVLAKETDESLTNWLINQRKQNKMETKKEMDSGKIHKYIKQLEDNIAFYKEQNELLEKTIESIKKPSAIINDVELQDLLKESYSKEEIVTAYNRMMKYEGISLDRSGGLITDTFIEFLDGLRDE